MGNRRLQGRRCSAFVTTLATTIPKCHKQHILGLVQAAKEMPGGGGGRDNDEKPSLPSYGTIDDTAAIELDQPGRS